VAEDYVKAFEQQFKVHRHIVEVGRVRLALPAVWTQSKWEKLSRKEQQLVYNACTSFPYYLQYVYLPFKSEIEGERCPDELPEFMGRFAGTIQARVPPELLPFDHTEFNPEIPWRVCRVWPTGCFKSSLLEAFESWIMGVNPNVAIVKGLAKAELGERFVDFHQSNIANNVIYQFVFGDLNPKATEGDRTWRNDQFVVERPLPHSAPTYAIVGYQGSFEGTRFHIGLLDDIVDFNNCKTETARLAQSMWVSQVFERRLHPRRRMLFAIGTIHHRADFYGGCREQARNDGTWDYEEIAMIPQKAITAGLWPPRKVRPDQPYSMDNVIIPETLPVLWDFWTPKALVEEFIASPHAFARTRLNQTHDPESGLFTAGDLDFCLADGARDPEGNQKVELCLWNFTDGIPAEGSPIREMYAAAGVDIEYAVVTADFAATDVTPGKDPDWTVFMLWGWCRNTKRRVLLDMRRFRTGNPQVVKDRLANFVGAYVSVIRKVAGEANAVDKMFVRDLGTFLRERVGVGVGVVELKGEKGELIESFKDLIYDKGVWVPYSPRSPRTRALVKVFREEMLDYPGGRHDDTLITAVHHLRLLKAGSFSGGVSAMVVGGHEDDDEEAEPEAEVYVPVDGWTQARIAREKVLACPTRGIIGTVPQAAGYR